MRRGRKSQVAGRGFLLASLLLLAPSLFAQSVAFTHRGVVVAHDHVIDLYDSQTLQRIWRTDGVEYAGAIVTDNTCDLRAATCDLAVFDPLANLARIIDVQSGKATTITTGETPIAGAYVGHQLFILERDARALERIGADGARASINTGAGPQFLSVAGNNLVVYSSREGRLQVITASPFAVAREMKIEPFAVDLIADEHYAYLAYPHKSRIDIVDLDKMERLGEQKAGSMPMDIQFLSNPTLLNARTLAVADPPGHRVLLLEGKQGAAEAFARGFLHGLLGLSLYGSAAKLPAGVDTIVAREGHWVAYDSSTNTLYRVASHHTEVLAAGIAPHAFAVGDDAVYLWQNGTLVAKK